ncbi:MAG: transcription-repair coupling factor, partial [Acetivibrio ethanolgignens]
MKTLLEPLKELNEFIGARRNLLKKQTPIQLSGCIDSQKSHVICGLGKDYPYRIIITYSELKAKEIFEDYKLYDREVFLYPAKDVIFYSADIHGNAIVRERLRLLRRLIEKKPATIIMTLDGGMDRLLPLEFLAEKVIAVKEADIIDLEQIKKDLLQLGYERCGQVEGPGQFAVRGGIIDIFPLTEECPYRIELWDDEIDTIRSFDVESQRSIETVPELSIYPASEIIMDEETLARGLTTIEKDKEAYVKKLREEGKLEEVRRIKDIIGEFKETMDIYSGSMGLESYIRYFYENTVSFFDYFTEENAVFFLDEPLRAAEKGEAVELEFRESMTGRIDKGYILPGQMDVIFSYKELFGRLSTRHLVLLNTMDIKLKDFPVKEQLSFTVKSVNPYNNNFELLVKDLEQFHKKGYRVLLLSGSRTRAVRLSKDLRDYDLNVFYSDDMEKML